MRISTTQTAVASALLFVLVASILVADASAFVPGQVCSKSTRNGNLAFVSRSKIRDLAFTSCEATQSSSRRAFPTRLFSGDDDDDGDDMMDMDMDMGMDDDDYNDDDYDDTALIIDVEGDGDYDYDFDDDDEDDVLEDDPYVGLASSEFGDADASSSSSALATTGSEALTTDLDWGGALGSLRTRMEDVESGTSGDPSQALFRMMSAPSPNQIIGKFVSSANPQVVQAMSGAVTSLLGGLSNPNMGVELQVKASGEKIGSLCFQLQMTGA